MESTLHRQLKELYAPDGAQREVVVRGYRIDAICDERLIEIQAASLSSLVVKTRELLTTHDVTVVKPLAARKFIVKRDKATGEILSQRYSPVRETSLHLFDELVYFIPVFPHPRLRIEVLLAEWEEHRVTKPKHRRFRNDYRVTDKFLTSVQSRIAVETAEDLLSLLPARPEAPFTTQELAACCEIPRWRAQKVAYCLRKAGAIDEDGKRGNALQYRYPRKRRRKPAA